MKENYYLNEVQISFFFLNFKPTISPKWPDNRWVKNPVAFNQTKSSPSEPPETVISELQQIQDTISLCPINWWESWK